MWKWMGLFLRKNHLLSCWGWLSLLNWIGTLTFPANISCFTRSVQDLFRVTIFRLPRRLEDVFPIRLPKTSSRRLCKTSSTRFQGVFITSSRCVCKTSSRRRLVIMSWKRLKDVLEDKKMLQWRRLQDVFGKSSPKRMFVGLSLFLKLPPRKLEPWLVLWIFFLLMLLCISINLPHGHSWNIVVMSGLVLICYLELLDKLLKRICRTVGPSLAASSPKCSQLKYFLWVLLW